MNLSSIFSFNTLLLSRSDGARFAGVICMAALFVGSAESIVRLDNKPKSLPFESTRTGTLIDYALNTDQPIDYLFMGSSQCAYNISPYHFSEEWSLQSNEQIKGLNLGIPGSNIRTVTSFYDKCGSIFKAKTVVFVISITGTENSVQTKIADNYGTDYLACGLPSIENHLMKLYLFRYRRQYRELRYQFYTIKRRNLSGDIVRRMGPNGFGWHPGQGGFLRMTDRNIEALPVSEQKKSYNMPESVTASLASNIINAQANAAKVVLLIPPQPPRFNKLMLDPDTEWNNFLDQIKSLSEKYGCIFLDHHSLTDFPDTSFFDNTHLINDEAVRYSQVLAKDLYKAIKKQ